MNKSAKNPIFWIPSVYFAMGLPFVSLSLVAVIMLKDLGIGEASITFCTSLLILPYTLKPIWSPLLELYRTKKFFVLITQMISGICFGLVAFCLPIPDFFAFVIAIFAVIAFSGATHDIATDGIYLTALDKQTQAKYIGWQGAFYNLAKILANGGLVWLAGKLIMYFKATHPDKAAFYAWMIIMTILGLLLVCLSIYHYFALPTGSKSVNKLSFNESLKSLWVVFKDFFTKKHILFYLLFIVFYRFTEGFALKMVPLFLKAAKNKGGLGLDNEQIGLIYGTFGTLAFIVGSILGGYFIAKFGLKKTIFTLCCIFNIPFIVYFLFALYQPDNLWTIGSGLVLEYFCYGFGFVGLTLFMMQEVATGEYQMSHYAFASGIMNLGVMLPGMISGWIYQQVGYQIFFLIALFVSIPAFFLTWFVPFTSKELKA